MNKHQQFIAAQKNMIDLIPKSKQNEVYNGLRTKLNIAMNEYISETCALEKDKHKLEIIKLRDKIHDLQSQIRKPEDVYPVGSGGKGE